MDSISITTEGPPHLKGSLAKYLLNEQMSDKFIEAIAYLVEYLLSQRMTVWNQRNVPSCS